MTAAAVGRWACLLVVLVAPGCVTLGDGGGHRHALAPPFPRPYGEPIVVEKTIEVRGDFDGRGRMYLPKGLGDGGQSEKQDPVFVLKGDRSVLRNVHYLGADGVHIRGDDCRMVNCVNHDVGEDAVTVEGDRAWIDRCWFRGATDKVNQVNDGSVTVTRCVADDFGKFVRLNGGREKRKLLATVEDCELFNGRSAGLAASHARGEIRARGNRFFGGSAGFEPLSVRDGAKLREEGNWWDRGPVTRRR